MKLKDFETRMVHDGKRNNREVKIYCEVCGKEAWAKWQRVREGRGRFCSLDCYNYLQVEEGKKTWGKEYARFHIDKSRQCWYAYWRNKDTGKLNSTTKARFLWEQEHGVLLANQVVTYIDGDPKNCELNNLEIMSRSDWNKIHLIGHAVSEEAKNKMSNAHSGKILSDSHKLKISNSLRDRWASGEFKLIHMGENSALWRGGTKKPYPPEFGENLKDSIHDRDGYKCRLCGEAENGDRAFPIHHIDGNKNNNDPENLIVFCLMCHGHVHGKHKIDDPVILAFRSMLNYTGEENEKI